MLLCPDGGRIVASRREGLISIGRIAHCAQVEGGYELEEEYVVAPRREGLNEMESRLWRPDERG